MNFQFHVLRVWTFEGQPEVSAIGVVESGTILPPATAHVVDRDVAVEIESIALGGGRPVTGHDNELTLVLRCPNVDPTSLEGCRLVSTSSERK
jgi:hypothetical protein